MTFVGCGLRWFDDSLRVAVIGVGVVGVAIVFSVVDGAEPNDGADGEARANVRYTVDAQ